MVEYEKKIILTADEYNAIVMLVRKCKTAKKQVNYYFDTNDLAMHKKGITCRIREKNGIYKATIKYHDAEYPDCSFEEDLAERASFEPHIFNRIGLCCRGMLITERTIIHKDIFCEMVIDRNTYLGYTDFELEIEYSKESEHRATELLEDIGRILVKARLVRDTNEFMKRVGQGQPKSQRFFAKKMEGGEGHAARFK